MCYYLKLFCFKKIDVSYKEKTTLSHAKTTADDFVLKLHHTIIFYQPSFRMLVGFHDVVHVFDTAQINPRFHDAVGNSGFFDQSSEEGLVQFDHIGSAGFGDKLE